MLSGFARVALGLTMAASDGTSTILRKLQFQTQTKGLEKCTDQIHGFEKPWIQTCLMFIGEASVVFYLIANIIIRKYFKKVPHINSSSSSKFNRNNIHLLLYFMLFSLLDLAGTTIAGTGLLFIPGSAFQILRGAVIICTEVGSIFAFKRRSSVVKWVGIILVIICLILVGISVNTEGIESIVGKFRKLTRNIRENG
ncbi:MAG: hypothetical protein EZS28_045730, partial [Streblomastix strix]